MANPTAPTAIAAAASAPRPSVAVLRRPSAPSVTPRPPRMIGALRKNASTPRRPTSAQTKPTFAGRFRAPASSQAQRPTNAKSATVSRTTTGTRTTPSQSWGTKNVASLHHDSPESLIPSTLGKKTAALAVTAAPTQRSPFRRRDRPSTRRSVFQPDPGLYVGGLLGQRTRSLQPGVGQRARRTGIPSEGPHEWSVRGA